MRAVYAAVVGILLVTGCSSESPKFSVAGARVDAVHRCPGGSVDARYDVHATVDVSNTTSKQVTIESATADMVLASITGSWLERLGDRYEAGSVVVSPSSIAPSSSAKLDVTIPSSCSSNAYGSSQTSSGSYTVTIHLVTSAGAFSFTAGNRHEILAA